MEAFLVEFLTTNDWGTPDRAKETSGRMPGKNPEEIEFSEEYLDESLQQFLDEFLKKFV